MKRIHILSSIVPIALLAAGAAFAAGDDMKPQSSQSGAANMRRINQEKLDQQFTAKDLIGATVYDSAGERIGSIADFSSDSLSTRFQNRSAGGSPASAQDAMALSGPTIYISVGGLLGIGDDIVAVPAQSVSFDAENERFTLDATKQDVETFAQAEPAEEDEYSAKQSFDSDISSIESALQQDERLTDVSISRKDEKLVLKGSVQSQSDKQRAQSLAESQSDLEIDNKIEIKKSEY